MADTQIISSTTLVTTVIGTILGSGVISAIVSGLFNHSSKDNEWRSNHLSDDKKVVRETLDELNRYLEMTQPLDNTHTEQHFQFDMKFATRYIYKLTLYLDIGNKHATELVETYSTLIGQLRNYVNLWRQLNNRFELAEPTSREECLYLLEQSARIANIYFAEYYPKPSIWLKIRKCLCCS